MDLYKNILEKNVYNNSFRINAKTIGIVKLSFIGANSIIVAIIAHVSAISIGKKINKTISATTKHAKVPSIVFL